MKKYVIRETVDHYHSVVVDDDVDMWEVITNAYADRKMYNTGYDAVRSIMNEDGIPFTLEPNYCGTEIVDITLDDVYE